MTWHLVLALILGVLMAASDARVLPRKNVPYRVTVSLVDADGDLVTGATGLDSELSKDGGTFTDCVNEATELATLSGTYALDLTAAEMNADTVAVLVKSASAKTTPVVLYPEEVGDVRVDTQVVADAFLTRNWVSVAGAASRSTLNAFRALRNKWALTFGSLLVTTEDDTTPAWTSAVTQTGVATRTIGIVPTHFTIPVVRSWTAVAPLSSVGAPLQVATTAPAVTTQTPVTMASDTGAAAFEPKLILLTQSQNANEAGAPIWLDPAYIASKMSVIQTLPFDGIALHSQTGAYTLMDGALHSVASIAAEWAPLDGAAWAPHQVHNFAVVNVKKPADFFDDWSNTIQSFANLATVLQDIGIQGILFDNEEYSDQIWAYPSTVAYSGTKTLQQYYDQAQLRAQQIMTAVNAVYPTAQWMVLLSPNSETPNTPTTVWGWNVNVNNLRGAFTVGLMMQSNLPVVDGNEISYGYRTQTEFDAAYTWNKTGIPANAAFVPAAFQSAYPNKVSIGESVYNQNISSGQPPNPRVMDLTVYPTVMSMALNSVEKFMWLYWEGGNWYNPVGSTYGIPQAWYDATRNAWLATRA